MSSDIRIQAAREYLDGARTRKVTELPPSLLVRECAELRRALGQVLHVIGDGTVLPADRAETVLLALIDAASARVVIGCEACDEAERRDQDACERHQADMDMSIRYTRTLEWLADAAGLPEAAWVEVNPDRPRPEAGK